MKTQLLTLELCLQLFVACNKNQFKHHTATYKLYMQNTDTAVTGNYKVRIVDFFHN